jgi:hypothetical protein
MRTLRPSATLRNTHPAEDYFVSEFLKLQAY